MRQFQTPHWEYALKVFSRLEKSRPYSLRFRLAYTLLYINNISFGERLKIFAGHLAGFFKLWLVIAKYQLKRGNVFPNGPLTIVMVSKNPVYLQTMRLPLEHMIREKWPLLILYPKNNEKEVWKKYPQEWQIHAVPFESIVCARSSTGRIGRTLLAPFAALADTVWFMFSGVKGSFWLAPAFARHALLHHFYDKALQKLYRPDMTLAAPNDHWMWEALHYDAANAAGAKTRVLQHGVINDITYPLFAEQFLAWGQYDVEQMVEMNGARPEEIKATGSPAFDALYKRLSGEQAVQTSRFESSYVTFLAQYFYSARFMDPEIYRQSVHNVYALADVVRSFDKTLVIKLHPAGPPEHFDDAPEGVILTAAPLMEVLEKTCLAITFDSTAMLEATIARIPVAQAFVRGQERIYDYSRYGLSDVCWTKEELMQWVKDLLSSPQVYEARVARGTAALHDHYTALGHSLPLLVEELKANSHLSEKHL